MFKRPALDLWKVESDHHVGIPTFCKDLDLTLGSGIALGLITELCGPSGSGKTQLCLQLSASVQIPSALGGLEGRVAYLDTKYGFSPKRLREMGRACIEHCVKLTRARSKNSEGILAGFTEESILDNVLFAQVQTPSHIFEAIAELQSKLFEGEKVRNPCLGIHGNTRHEIRLIVIDSLSFLIRNTITSAFERVQCAHEILTLLHKLTHRFACAAVITNDVMASVSNSDSASQETLIVPALGGSHSHKINQRIILGRMESSDDPLHDGLYVASIEKSLFAPRVSIPFRIEREGIRSGKVLAHNGAKCLLPASSSQSNFITRKSTSDSLEGGLEGGKRDQNVTIVTA